MEISYNLLKTEPTIEAGYVNQLNIRGHLD